MKVIIVGASGIIGRKIDIAISESHEVVRVGTTSGDIQCDYTNADSVREMFGAVGPFDALVAVVGGDGIFKKFEQAGADYRYGFDRKFLSQIRLVRLGQASIRDNGSFTLTSGFLSHYPNPASIAIGPLNAAVDTYVQNVAPLMPRRIRLNVVSPRACCCTRTTGLGTGHRRTMRT